MDYSHNNNMKRKRGYRTQAKRVQNKIGLTFFRVVIAAVLVGGFAAVGVGLGLYMGILKNSPTLNLMSIQPETYTSIIYDSKTGEETDRLSGEENRVYVTSNRVPDNLKNAFVAIEDERFYSHNGIDIRGMGRAVYLLISTKGGTTHGASTITQQLIKNNLGKTTNTLISKLQEQYLAVQFEKRLSEPDMLGSKAAAKDYILEVYMNTISLGRGYYGVQTAAWNYYGKEVADLTLSECATIAAITQNPSKYPPDLQPENNRIRQSAVLKKMNELGFITDKEYKDAMDDPVYERVIQGVKPTDGSGIVHNFFTDALINAVSKDLQEQYQITDIEASYWIYNKGLQIFSTEDKNIQAIVDGVFLDDSNFPAGDFEIDVTYVYSVYNSITKKTTNSERKKTVKNLDDVDAFVASVQNEVLTANDDILSDRVVLSSQPQASFVIIDYHTGQVKAISGGRGEKTVNRAFNRATDATRSPGSQFKVVASYAPALDLGRITAATVIDDAPFTYNGYTPRNWWGSSYEGLSTVRRGVYRSMNILAVKNFLNTGIDTSFAYLQNFGFTTLVESETRGNRVLSDKVPALPLGGLTDGVKQIELAAAYGTIANGGEYNKPVFYTKVLDHDGNVLLENRQEPRQVIKKQTAYVLIDIMKDTVRVGTGTKAAFKNVKMPIAGKTGTSTDSFDLGFSGVTPYYAATVWMGFDQQKRIKDSSSNHLLIWSKIMEEVHKDLPEKDFEKPDGITYATVCKDSAKLPTELCKRDPRGDRSYSEIFVSGTQPTDYCEVHQEILMDTSTSMLAGPNCPPWDVQMRVGIVRPEPVDSGASIADRAYEITPAMKAGEECTYHNGEIYWEDGLWDNGFPSNMTGPDFTNPTSEPLPEFPWSTEVPTNIGDFGGDLPIVPPAMEVPQGDNGFEPLPPDNGIDSWMLDEQ